MARYKIRSGIISPKATVGDLFGSKKHRSILDVPTNLSTFLQQLPMGAEYVADEIIFKHTLFPFFAPFLPPGRIQHAITAMISNGGRGIHNTIGVTASKVKAPKFLRFCPQCFVEDEQTFGEAYWHRVHQIPGIAVCPLHVTPLQDSLAPIHDINPHNYHACTSEVCLIKPNAVVYSQKAMQELSQLSKDVAWVMNTKLTSRELSWFKERYVEALIQKGFATPKGRVFQNDFLLDFSNYYSDECLRQAQSLIKSNGTNWLSNIVRYPRKAFHPIRHLLVIRYLFGSVERFFTSTKPYQPFGNAPWLCLNGAADHYLQPVVHKCQVTYCKDTKKPVGTFLCDCGFVYSRRGPDVCESDRFKIGRIKVFGQVWHNKLLELHSMGMSFRQIAHTLKVDINTAIKYSRLIKGNNSMLESLNNTVTIGDENVRATHRAIWLHEQTTKPSLTKTQIRRIIPQSYSWLYRNDREWLNENSPILTNRKHKNRLVNWNQRDRLAYSKIRSVVSKLLKAEGKPIRITKTKIGKLAGMLPWIEKDLSKMPMTEKYIKLVAESVQEFQMRRISWGVKCILERNEVLVKWKIERIAGLRKGYSEQIEKYIEKVLSCSGLNMKSMYFE